MVEVFSGRKGYKVGRRCKQRQKQTASLSKRAAGLPMYAIGVIIVGIIILAVVLIFIFMVGGESTNITEGLFGIQQGVTSNATETATGFAGG